MLKQRSQKTTWSRTATSAAASVARLRVGRAEQVVGQALGGLGPDAGQARERLDQAGDGLDERGGHAVAAYIPGSAGRRSRRAIFASASSREAREGVVDRGDDEVLEHLDVVRVDGRRVDRDADAAPACR